MQKLSSFTMVSLDGFFATELGDLTWAHRADDPEHSAFVANNAKSGGALLFGRTTYDMMAQYWPTPAAAKSEPVVAERMNALPKYVISHDLERPSWKNTTVLRGNLSTEVDKLKREAKSDITILGSGSIVAQCAAAGLIDELQFMLYPLALGAGKRVFSDARGHMTLALELVESRTFKNGIVFLRYTQKH